MVSKFLHLTSTISATTLPLFSSYAPFMVSSCAISVSEKVSALDVTVVLPMQKKMSTEIVIKKQQGISNDWVAMWERLWRASIYS